NLQSTCSTLQSLRPIILRKKIIASISIKTSTAPVIMQLCIAQLLLLVLLLPTDTYAVRTSAVELKRMNFFKRPLNHFGAVLFQRHVDNSLSFAQNWTSYVNGFGDPSGNYWIGLEQLSAMTKDRSCKFIFEGVRLNGSLMSATFRGFQVRGADENYRLILLGPMEPGGDLYHGIAGYHNGSQFSTIDVDNDGSRKYTCSRGRGQGGWWFNNCAYFNPNAPIFSQAQLGRVECWDFCSALGRRWVCLNETRLSFKCS
ncbi:hypothetical protein BOX15_Mlig025557g1, partial [Macrostomum lignano]